MKLYWAPASPYARKVLLLAHEAGLFEKLELIDGRGTPWDRNAETAAYNPLGKVPCLIPAEGPALYDSRVICEYLDSLHEGPTFFPQGEARWRALTLQSLADGLLDAGLLLRYEAMRPEGERSASWIAGQTAKTEAALDRLEARWIAHLNGPLDIGHLAAASALGWLAFRKPLAQGAGDGLAARPRLKAWYEGFARRPSMQATAPRD